MTNRWKAIDGAEITGDIDRNKEEIGFVRIFSPYVALEAEQRLMESYFRREEVVATSVVG